MRVAQVAYVLTVGVLATCGVAGGSSALILLAALLALPASVVALVGYYVAYGLLAQVPGANPPSGELAGWFAVTAGVGLVVVLAAAALVNLVLLRLLLRRRRAVPVDDDSRPDVPAC